MNVCFRPRDFPRPGKDAAEDEIQLLGFDRKHPTKPRYVDPIEDPELRPEDESEEGIELVLHPDLLTAEHPELLGLLREFWMVHRRWSRREYARASGIEVDAWEAMRAAESRERVREQRRMMDEAKESRP